jgi:hypothetical protein
MWIKIKGLCEEPFLFGGNIILKSEIFENELLFSVV